MTGRIRDEHLPVVDLPSAKGGPPAQTPARVERAARSRSQTAAVRRYLAMIEAGREGPTPAQVRAQLEQAEVALAAATTSLRRVVLLARVDELRTALAAAQRAEKDRTAAEAGFVKAAAPWGRRQRPPVTWRAWRAMGVEPAVLRRAGVPE